MKPFIILSIALAFLILVPPALSYRNGSSGGPSSVVAFKGREHWCVGNFIAAVPGQYDVMATAAHCLADFSTGGAEILKGATLGARSRNVLTHSHNSSPHSVNQDYDFALVFFEDGTANGVTPLSEYSSDKKDNVSSSSWETSTQTLISGSSRIFELNFDTSGTKPLGYILHESDGGLPDEPGESGSPLFNSQGLQIGVLHGCGDGNLEKPFNKSGFSCTFSAALSEHALTILTKAKQQYPEALADIDLQKLQTLGAQPTPSVAPQQTAQNTQPTAQNQPAQPISQKPPISPPPPATQSTAVAASPQQTSPTQAPPASAPWSTQPTAPKPLPPPPKLAQAKPQLSAVLKRILNTNRHPQTGSPGAKLVITLDEDLGED